MNALALAPRIGSDCAGLVYTWVLRLLRAVAVIQQHARRWLVSGKRFWKARLARQMGDLYLLHIQEEHGFFWLPPQVADGFRWIDDGDTEVLQNVIGWEWTSGPATQSLLHQFRANGIVADAILHSVYYFKWYNAFPIQHSLRYFDDPSYACVP